MTVAALAKPRRTRAKPTETDYGDRHMPLAADERRSHPARKAPGRPGPHV